MSKSSIKHKWVEKADGSCTHSGLWTIENPTSIKGTFDSPVFEGLKTNFLLSITGPDVKGDFVITMKIVSPFEQKINAKMILAVITNGNRKVQVSSYTTITNTLPYTKNILGPAQDIYGPNGFIYQNKLNVRFQVTWEQSIQCQSCISPCNDPCSPCKVDTIPGFVGLLNQGATCFMNSVLQALYHINDFRKLVFSIPIPEDLDEENSVVFNLQSLFCDMQLSQEPCQTISLTRSFGWDQQETLLQKDAQEFMQMFFALIEKGIIGKDDNKWFKWFQDLFFFNTERTINTVDRTYTNIQVETMNELILDVCNLETLNQSLDLYTSQETIKDYQNLYGATDAIMQTKFQTLPSVLIIHLKRFDYNKKSKCIEKINAKFMFPDNIDMAPYMVEQTQTLNYELYAVLVHSGSVNSGHYYCFISNKESTGKWIKCNDKFVTNAKPSLATENNFGGVGSTSAYLLIYVRQDMNRTLFDAIPEKSIPEELITKYKSYKQQIIEEEKAKNKINFKVCYESDFAKSGKISEFGICVMNSTKTITLSRSDTEEELVSKCAQEMKLKPNQIRLWKCKNNGAPYSFIRTNSKAKLDIFSVNSSPVIFAQMLQPKEILELQTNESLVFVKYYNYVSKKSSNISFLGAVRVQNQDPIYTLLNFINTKINPPINESICVYVETEESAIAIQPGESFENLLITTGSILIFQRATNIKNVPDFIDNNKINTDYLFESTPITTKEFQKRIELVNSYEIIEAETYNTVDNYLNFKLGNLFTISIADYMKPSITLMKLRFPLTYRLADLKYVISRTALKSRYDPHFASLLLYTQFQYKPSCCPIELAEQQSLYVFFMNARKSSKGKREPEPTIYFRLLLGISEEQLKARIKRKIFYFVDGYNLKEIITLFLEKTATPLDVINELQQLNIAKHKREFNVYAVSRGSIVRKMDLNQEFFGGTYDIKVDAIPDEWLNLPEDTRFIPAEYRRINAKSIAQPMGVPFFFVVKKDEVFSDTKNRLGRQLMNPINVDELCISLQTPHVEHPLNDNEVLYNMLENNSKLLITYPPEELIRTPSKLAQSIRSSVI